MKAGFISLGCAKNLVDTEVMLGIMREHGIDITNEPAEADILIVNTCAFIESAKEESITTMPQPDRGGLPWTAVWSAAA